MAETNTRKYAKPSFAHWQSVLDCIRAVLGVQGNRSCLDAISLLERIPRSVRRTATRRLPVTAYFGNALSLTHGSVSALAGEIDAAAISLDWRQPYPRLQTGAQFQRNYAEAEIIGSHGPLMMEKAAVGLFLLGPGTYFPSHIREDRQIIMVLGGTGDFQRGHGAWVPKPPASFVFQKSLMPQAFRTSGEPLLCLYVRMGAGADRPAVLKASVPG